jgi:DNA-binding transcriptional ArsR family regulator
MDLRWTPKPEASERLEADLARFCKAIGHPARVRILRELMSREDATCGGLASGLPLAQSTVSQHLRVLREASLVESETRGAQRAYHLNQATLTRFRTLMALLTSREDQ